MSTITALASDGISIVYLDGEGAGTQLSPFRARHVLAPGAEVFASQQGEWVVSLDALSLEALSSIEVNVSNSQIEISNDVGNPVPVIDQHAQALTNSELRSAPIEVTLTSGGLGGSSGGLVIDPNSPPSYAVNTPIAPSTDNQGRLLVSPRSLQAPTDSVAVEPTPGVTTYRNPQVGITPVSVKGQAGSLHGWSIINPNIRSVYLKFYDEDAVDTEVGVTPVKLTLCVPPGDYFTPGIFITEPSLVAFESFTNAISVAVTSELGDASDDEAELPVHVSLRYR